MSSADFNKIALGSGIYTVPEISRILTIPAAKVRRYIRDFLDDRSGKKLFQETYSYKGSSDKLYVNFHVLIELYCMFQLRAEGFSVQKIMSSREVMIKDLDTPFPFASQNVLFDGKNIFYNYFEDIVKADGKRQMSFKKLLKDFVKNIDFDKQLLAHRFWPNGRENSIVIDPHHQFGQPTINTTNINVATIHSMFESGESVASLCVLFDLTEKQVNDAVQFYCRAA